jgi:hypothetical protein
LVINRGCHMDQNLWWKNSIIPHVIMSLSINEIHH